MREGFPIKKLFFFAVIVGVNYVFFELVSFALFKVKYGEYSRHDMQLERINTINEIESGSLFTVHSNEVLKDGGKVIVKEILHPYAGYTIDGKRRKESCTANDAITTECYTRIRMLDDGPIPKKSANTLNVALLGGSVAVGTANDSLKGYYEKLLAKLPEYQGFEVNLDVMAAGGYRQPQSLMLLTYMYTLGAEYDLVIALDGFNEIGIAASEYKWNKIHPAFPRSWSARVSNVVSQEAIELQAEKMLLEKKHLGRARFMSNPWSRNSFLSNLLWKVFHTRYQAERGVVARKLNAEADVAENSRELEYEKLGPEYRFSDWEGLVKDSAEIWENATYSSHGLATSQGAKFFHFIQPNQYVDGSKPKMSAQEKRIAFTDPNTGGYGAWYRMGYPFLREYQTELKQRGVNTRDLTYLFLDEERTVYIDNCCHFNNLGSTMIVEAIVDTIHQTNLAELGAERD